MALQQPEEISQPTPEQSYFSTAQGKFDATDDPTVNEDTTLGYAPNSVWYRTDTNQEWLCVDNTDGAAVWNERGTHSTFLRIGNVIRNSPTVNGLLYVGASNTLQSSPALGASQSVRRNSADTAFEAFTPQAAFASQSQNLFFASPNGSSGAPSFRAVVAADAPIFGSTGEVAFADASNKATSNSKFKFASNQVLIPLGSASAPGLAFADDSNTGIFGQGSNFFISVDGAFLFWLDANKLRFDVPLHGSIGTASAPSLTYSGAPTNGIYFSNSNEFHFTAGGTRRGGFNATDFDLAVNLSMADGKNLVFGTTTGTKIGTGSTQKIGFFGATPVARQLGLSYFTDNSGGDNTITVFGDPGATYNQTYWKDFVATILDYMTKNSGTWQNLGLTA